MAGSTADTRAYQRVEQACRAGGDSRQLRLRVLDAIRRRVGFEWYAFLLTDPDTTVGSAPLADVPEAVVGELPRLIRLKYLTPVNRWTAIGERGVALLRQTTGGDLHRSLVWRDMLSGHGVGDIVSLVFRDRFGCWGFLDLWRSGPESTFQPAEAAFLSSVVEPITTALRRSQGESFKANPRRAERAGPLVLLLSGDMDLVAQTPLAHEYLRVLVPPSADRPPIPAGAYNVAAQLLSVATGVDPHPARARVHLSDGLWLTMRAASIGAGGPRPATSGAGGVRPGTLGAGGGRPASIGAGSIEPGDQIVVSIEESSPAERIDLFARASGLSTRETELLGHLSKGHDTKTVARLMFLSEHTVQDHLKSIFSKTTVTSRKTLLSRAVGV